MGIVALGMSFVMLTGGLDFSVGSMVALSGIVSALLIKGAGCPFTRLFAIAIICCMASAITGVVGVLLDIPILVVSIAMQQILNGFNSVITGNQSIYGLKSRSSSWDRASFRICARPGGAPGHLRGDC